MITFITTTKPFRRQTRISQLNALNSWKKVHPDCEIIVFGDEFRTAEITRELDLIHIPDVEKSEYGTPLVSSMFELAKVRGKYPFQAYLNADIILLGDLAQAIKGAPFKRFLLVGQRTDLDLNEALDFENPTWISRLRTETAQRGNLQHPSGIDYFVYPRGLWPNLPPFAVGRAGYDNWLIYWCRRQGIPVVDCTTVITAVHQNHDYSHIAGGKQTVWFGEEARWNLTLAGGHEHAFTIADANWILTNDGLRRNFCRGDMRRLVDVFVALHPRARWIKRVQNSLAAVKGWILTRNRGGRI